VRAFRYWLEIASGLLWFQCPLFLLVLLSINATAQQHAQVGVNIVSV
jgi:hypothetical protein